MRILVLNGSPKGKDSVTLQTVEYLQILNQRAQKNVEFMRKRLGLSID